MHKDLAKIFSNLVSIFKVEIRVFVLAWRGTGIASTKCKGKLTATNTNNIIKHLLLLYFSYYYNYLLFIYIIGSYIIS